MLGGVKIIIVMKYKIDLLRKEIYQFNIITLTDPNDNEEKQI